MFGIGYYGSGPYAETGDKTIVVYVAQHVTPLLKYGSHTGVVDLLTTQTSLGPLLHFAAATGIVAFTPREITGRAQPLYNMLKFDTALMVGSYRQQSLGPLITFGQAAGVLDRTFTVSANSIAPLLKFGTPLGAESFERFSESLGPLLNYGVPTGLVETFGAASSLGPLLRFGQPATDAHEYIPSIFVRSEIDRIVVWSR